MAGLAHLWQFVRDQYGNIASVVGLTIAIAAILRDRKTRKIADEARSVANLALQRARLQLFRNDFTQLIHFMSESRDGCRARNWERALSRCDDSLIYMVRIQAGNLLFQVEKKQVTGHIEDLKTIRRVVNVHRSKDARKSISEGTIEEISNIILSLIEIDQRLRGSIWEE